MIARYRDNRVSVADIDGRRLSLKSQEYARHLLLCRTCRTYGDDPFSGELPCQTGRRIANEHGELARLFGERF